MPSPKLELRHEPSSFAFEAIGTLWSIGIYDDATDEKLYSLQKAIQKRIEQFDQHYSRFRSDSLVSIMASRAGTYDLPSDAKAMLDFYESLYVITNGAVTPLIGQVLSDAGYDAIYSLESKTLTSPPHLENVLSFTSNALTLHQPALLDFGAAGKGYLVDIIDHIIRKHSIKAFYIDAGGDILYRHTDRKLEIGLEHPADASQIIGVAHILDGALCGSASNRRRWGAYHHIISPHTLESPQHIRAVWVSADTAMLADGLTTALFFVTPDMLKKQYNFEYAIVYQDFSLEHSSGFPAEFYT